MNYDDLINHYGSQRAAGEALKTLEGRALAQSSVAEWKERGAIPHPRQAQYEIVSRGALKAKRFMVRP